MVSESPSGLDQASSDFAVVIKELRKKDPIAASRLKKRLKKKKAKDKSKQWMTPEELLTLKKSVVKSTLNDLPPGVEVEYVLPSIEELAEKYDSVYEYEHIFKKFRLDDKDHGEEEEVEERRLDFGDGEIDSDEEDEEVKPKISKKKMKHMSRYSIPQLKQLALRPDVVEVWDTTAADADFLVFLKGYRNTVQVPPHWCQKRRYMQGKRGLEKPNYKLPSYIENTKIAEIRAAIQEKDAQKSNKQRQKEKIRPKMHKMDIDYQTLHDAFFKYSLKPPLTRFGDLYYEGKENEMKMRKFKPGVLSDTLKDALSMANNAPPPWLINMQRYGPPPHYAGLKIPGLNAPIPFGAEYGYHPGGWGKPPVDEFGNPLYGDFSLEARLLANIDDSLWGEILSDGEEEEDETDTASTVPDGDGAKTPASVTGLDTPLIGGGMVTEASGLRSIASLVSGLETPESIDIRKRGTSTTTPKHYTILQPQPAPAQPGALFASNITYKMPGKTGQQGSGHVTPIGGLATPGGTATPNMGGLITPYGGGLITPYSIGVNGGMTPTMGDGTASGGVQTPAGKSGVTMTLNPTEMEEEGVFAADVIRLQLKQHEEAAMRAKQAAGQVEPQDVKRRKAEAGADGTTKKKKKEKFKF